MKRNIIIVFIFGYSIFSFASNQVIPSGARIVGQSQRAAAPVNDPIPDIKIKKDEVEYLKKNGDLRYYRLLNGTLIVTKKNNVLFVKEKGKRARKIDKRMTMAQIRIFIDAEVLQDEADNEYESEQRPVNFTGVKFVRRKGKFHMYRLPRGDLVVINFVTIVAVKMKNGSLRPIMRVLANKEKKILAAARRGAR